MCGRTHEEMSKRKAEKKQNRKQQRGKEEVKEDDRGAEWSKGFLSPPATPYVCERQKKPLWCFNTAHDECTSQNALCLCHTVYQKFTCSA